MSSSSTRCGNKKLPVLDKRESVVEGIRKRIEEKVLKL